jgi:hypothetical protein
MTQHDSKRREDWQRITLRLPADLYHHLVESAEEHRQSLNSRVMDLLLQNERPAAEPKISESLISSWAKTLLDVQRRIAELELKLARGKPVMTRYTYGKGVEEGFRALDAFAANRTQN